MLNALPDVEGIETIDPHDCGESQMSDASPDVEGIETRPISSLCLEARSQMHRPMLRALKPFLHQVVDEAFKSDASPDVEGIETPPST